MLQAPVARERIGPQSTRQLARHDLGLEQVLQPEANARNRLVEPEQLCSILDMHERQARIELEVIDLENAYDRELPHPRHDPRRRHLTLWRHHDHPLTRRRAQRGGELAPKNDAELTWFEGIQAAVTHVLADLGDFLFLFGHDSPNEDAVHFGPVREQTLARNERGRRYDLRMAGRDGLHLLPVGELPPHPAHLHVRGDRKYPRADLPLKPVHDRQHRDECGHAERDANNGYGRNKGDDASALTRARIAQSNEEFVRHQVCAPPLLIDFAPSLPPSLLEG